VNCRIALPGLGKGRAILRLSLAGQEDPGKGQEPR